MGSAVGAEKIAAARVGLSLSAYRAKIASGEKWCTACKAWHLKSAFAADRSRTDGLSAKCTASRSTGRPRGWQGKKPINPATGRPGPAPKPGRDGDKKQARERVNREVRTGRIPHPNALPCTDCGHVWRPGGRRHEYDHHKGYAAEHHLSVEPVCVRCHRRRDYDEAIRQRDGEGRYVGKKRAGRLLDGVEHNGVPETAHG